MELVFDTISTSDFLSIKIENNKIKISVDKRFKPNTKEDEKIFKYLLILLNNEVKNLKNYKSLGFDFIESAIGDLLIYEDYFEKIKNELQLNLLRIEKEDFITLLSCIIKGENTHTIINKYKTKFSLNTFGLIWNHTFDKELDLLIKHLEKTYLIQKNPLSSKKLQTFTMNSSNTEIKGTFFEFFIELLLFYNDKFTFKVDFTGFSKNSEKREKNNIYPDIIGIDSINKNIVIIDGKCYKHSNEVSIKEVLLNEIVVLNAMEKYNKKFNNLYNIALVPQDSKSETLIIKKRRTIKKHQVIIIDINPFKFFSQKLNIEHIIEKIKDLDINKTLYTKIDGEIVLNNKMIDFLNQSI